MKPRFFAIFALIAATCFITGALLVTPDFLSTLTNDGVIQPSYLPLIRFYRVFSGGAGLLLLFSAAALAWRPAQFLSWISGVVFQDPAQSEKGGSVKLFLISFSFMYFEILMLRWVGSEFRIMAFFKNIIMMACIFGLGLGFALTTSRWRFNNLFVVLTALFTMVMNMGSKKLFLLVHSPGTGDEHIWTTARLLESTGSLMLESLLFYGSVLFLFLWIAFLFIGPAQIAGRLMHQLPPLKAYSINVAGGLFALVTFSLLSWFSTPPEIWFGLGFALALWFYLEDKAWFALSALAAAASIGLFLGNRYLDIRWSPYYKIQTSDSYMPDDKGKLVKIGFEHFVNGAGFQETLDLHEVPLPAYLNRYDLKYNLPYRIKPAKEVLIVGGGTGNNAAAAVRNNAQHIDVAEIDPMIVQIGREIHPENPYENQKVHVYINDARNFFKTTHRKYDLIVFGLLDSHTMFSSMASVRLDNFVYTKESMAQVKRLLKPDGVVVLDFAVGKPWIGNRLAQVLKDVFGQEPLSTQFGMFVAGPGVAASTWSRHPIFSNPLYASGRAEAATDDWPYLYLRAKEIPGTYLVMLSIILAACLVVVLKTSPETRKPQWHFFFLGSGFLLVEFKSIAEAALLFGSTWIVNAFVIAGVLLMILAANALANRLQNINRNVFYVLLISSLVLNYLLPVSSWLGSADYVTKGIVSSIFLALPLFFAGLIFAGSIRLTTQIGAALSSNLLGTVLGGMFEYASLAVGIHQLYLLAGMFYLLSWVATLKQQPRAPLHTVAGSS